METNKFLKWEKFGIYFLLVAIFFMLQVINLRISTMDRMLICINNQINTLPAFMESGLADDATRERLLSYIEASCDANVIIGKK